MTDIKSRIESLTGRETSWEALCLFPSTRNLDPFYIGEKAIVHLQRFVGHFIILWDSVSIWGCLYSVLPRFDACVEEIENLELLVKGDMEDEIEKEEYLAQLEEMYEVLYALKDYRLHYLLESFWVDPSEEYYDPHCDMPVNGKYQSLKEMASGE